jgi:hypothetical protein
VELQIYAIHQPQRFEFVFGKFAGKPSRDLIAKFSHAFRYKSAIKFIVYVHVRRST